MSLFSILILLILCIYLTSSYGKSNPDFDYYYPSYEEETTKTTISTTIVQNLLKASQYLSYGSMVYLGYSLARNILNQQHSTKTLYKPPQFLPSNRTNEEYQHDNEEIWNAILSLHNQQQTLNESWSKYQTEDLPMEQRLLDEINLAITKYETRIVELENQSDTSIKHLNEIQRELNRLSQDQINAFVSKELQQALIDFKTKELPLIIQSMQNQTILQELQGFKTKIQQFLTQKSSTEGELKQSSKN